jgi:hypothetical protein
VNELSLEELTQNKIAKAPSLRTINGIGGTLLGSYLINYEEKLYIKAYCVCFLYIPILVSAYYLVKEINENQYQFIAKISPRTMNKIEPNIMKRYLKVLIHGAGKLIIFAVAILIAFAILNFIRNK